MFIDLNCFLRWVMWPMGLLFVCMIVVYRPTREFAIHVETSCTVIGEGLQILTYARHSCMVIELWGFFKVPHLLWHGPSVYNLHLRGPVTLAPNLWRALGSGAVTTCFNDIGLSLLGLKHPNFRLWGDRSYPLRHRRNSNCLNTLVFVLSIKGTGLSAPL